MLRGKSRSISGTLVMVSAGQKTFQREVIFQRVDVRKPDEVADQQSHRRTPSSPRRVFLEG